MTASGVHMNIYALQKLQKEYRKKRLHAFEKCYNSERKLRSVAEPLRKQTVEIAQHIPCFWGRIMNVADLNYNNLSDVSAMKYLKEVYVEDLPLSETKLCDGTPALLVVYRVHFVFLPNNLMKNTEAIKTVSYKVSGWNDPFMEMLEPEVETEQGIVWNPGKDPRVSKPFKKRSGMECIASTQQQKIIPSFFHLFDELKHEDEDGEYSKVIENQKDEERKMHFKIIMGFVNEFVDRSISYFDESIPNRAAAMVGGFDILDDDEVDDDEEFLSKMEEDDEEDEDLKSPPDCTAQ